MCVRVHNEERACAVCQPRGFFLSLARRRSHHWTDGQHPPSLLPYPFIHSSSSPSITVFLSCVPQTPHHLSLSFPTSQHPLIPISHHTAAVINQCAVTVSCLLTLPSRRPLAPKLMLVRPAITSARGKRRATCAYTLMLTWLLSFNGQTFSTRLALK